MRLISYRVDGGIAAGACLLDGRVIRLDRWLEQHTGTGHHAGIMRLLWAGPAALAELADHLAAAAGDLVEVPRADWLAPVPRPGKIIGVGRNYRDHAGEMGEAPPAAPRLFGKFPSSTIPAAGPIPYPHRVTRLDYEAELAVIIGSTARDVAAVDALRHVAGYTLVNDVSAREYQFGDGPAQTTFAKSMDGFAPMGPWLVTADEVPDPQALDIASWLNGEPVQRASTADMIFPVAALIAYISSFMTLEPGDVIVTGTPAGVGAFRTPPRYLRRGDRFRMAVSGIGEMEHDVV